jgi:hypothetical protein
MAKKAEQPAAQNEDLKSQQQAPPPIDFGQFSASGFENITQNDLGIPFLVILQKGSPEVDKENPKYVKGLEQRDIVNSISKVKLGDKLSPLTFTPHGYQRLWVEWKPRTSGGGMVVAHATDAILRETTKNDKGQDVLRNGNIISTTGYMFGYVFDVGGVPLPEPMPAVIGFASTQLKACRTWLNWMQSLRITTSTGEQKTPPMYAYKWLLSTTPQSNPKGSWYGWKIDIGEMHNSLDTVKLLAGEAKKGLTARAGLIGGPAPDEEESAL